MASNSTKGKGKGGFGMTRRQRIEKAWIKYMDRRTNNERVSTKRQKGKENG